MSIEIGRALAQKEITIAQTLQDMTEQGYSPAEEGVTLPSVGDAERKERTLQRRLDDHGPVNMLAIEQFEACEVSLMQT